MTQEIIGLADWMKSPAGARVMAWETHQFELAVADVFGYHALQLGLPEVPGLMGSRMPHRWVLGNEADLVGGPPTAHVAAWADPAALPFADASMDLVVLPHTLELCADPRGVLREVERVLVPQGRVVLSLFNPLSLWGMRQGCAHAIQRVGADSPRRFFLPLAGGFIAPWRVRDWLGLMDLEVNTQRYGVYVWPTQSTAWLHRLDGMNRVGARWWPMMGALYFVEATKRVRGLRLLGPAWKPRKRVLQPSAATLCSPVSLISGAVRSSSQQTKDIQCRT